MDRTTSSEPSEVNVISASVASSPGVSMILILDSPTSYMIQRYNSDRIPKVERKTDLLELFAFGAGAVVYQQRRMVGMAREVTRHQVTHVSLNGE